jgi:hypothetical protein
LRLPSIDAMWIMLSLQIILNQIWWHPGFGACACIAVLHIKSTCHVPVSDAGIGMKEIVQLFAADVADATRLAKFGVT